MSANLYVHYLYEHSGLSTDLSSIFGENQIKRQIEIQKNQIQEKMGINEINIESLQKVAEQATKLLPTLSTTPLRKNLAILTNKKKPPTQDQIITTTNKLQQQIKQMQEDLNKYINFINNTKNSNKDKVSLNGLYSQEELRRLNNLGKQIETSSAFYSEFNKWTENNEELDNPWGIFQTAARLGNISAGFISEYLIANLLNEKFENKLVFKQSGTQKVKDGYQVGTSDISVKFAKEQGSVDFTLPGISIKRTGRIVDGNKQIIHLKSSTVGQLIKQGDLEQSGFDLYAFYNAYANYHRPAFSIGEDGTLSKDPDNMSNFKIKNIASLYRGFYLASLGTALTGSLTSGGDFAGYLIINDKVYSMIDILSKIIEDKGDTNVFALTDSSHSITNLNTKQKEIADKHSELFKPFEKDKTPDQLKKERSQGIIQAINSLSLNLNLQLKLNLSKLDK